MRQRDMVLATAERIAGLGYGLWDERTQSYVFVSEQFARFYGMSPDEFLAWQQREKRELQRLLAGGFAADIAANMFSLYDLLFGFLAVASAYRIAGGRSEEP